MPVTFVGVVDAPPSPALLTAGHGLPCYTMEFWAKVEQALAAVHRLPDRTTNEPLTEWLGPVRGGYRDATEPSEPLVAAGMALADVVAFVNACEPRDSTDLLVMSDVNLLTTLVNLARATPVPLGVRDALGWVLVCGAAASGRTRPVADRHATVEDVVGLWAAVGLAARGWVFTAAGFSPAEAAARVEDGSLDEARATVMAALAGAVLPCG